MQWSCWHVYLRPFGTKKITKASVPPSPMQVKYWYYVSIVKFILLYSVLLYITGILSNWKLILNRKVWWYYLVSTFFFCTCVLNSESQWLFPFHLDKLMFNIYWNWLNNVVSIPVACPTVQLVISKMSLVALWSKIDL